MRLIAILARIASCGCIALFFFGCGDHTGPQPGSILVSLSMTGAAPDADGCMVAVDGGAGQALQAEESFAFDGLSQGTHDVTISNVAANCILAGEASREVTVSANDTTPVDFSVDCPVPGSVEVTTRTTGSVVDPDGYMLVLDGETSLAVGVSGEVTFEEVAVGHHELELTDIADNCTAIGPNPISVTVSEGDLTGLALSVSCPPYYDHIAFMSLRDGSGDIFVMERDGSNPVNLTPDTAWLDGEPAWSPDGTRVAFIRQLPPPASSTPDIYVLNTADMSVTQLTYDGGHKPSWSPDGARIAFETSRDGNSEIYAMDADGSNPVNLTNHDANDYEPAWSPDGTQIAIATERDGNVEVYVMNADGSNATNVTNDPATDGSPDWSPDGTRIVFWSSRTPQGGLYIMGADGSNPTLLISQECIFDPKWSPDGLQIAFAGYCGSPGGYEILVLQADGSNLVNLTNHPDYDSSPAWSPMQ